MPYKGHVRNGVIVLDEPVSLEEGTAVAVQVMERHTQPANASAHSRYERYYSLIGALDSMPVDWAENHDKYLREQHGS